MAAFWFLEYFISPCEKATAYGGVRPPGPSGIAKCEMSGHMGSPLSFLILSGLRLAKMKIDAPLRVALISPAWKARLLLVSSQARALSSHACFQKSVIHATASTVPLELSTTFFPLGSVSAPPNAHVNGYVHAGASPNVWPSVWPIGLPFFFSAIPIFLYSSSVFGGWFAPTSANHDLRYAIRGAPVKYGRASHRLPSRAAASEWG